jgi:hypothetical protein
MAKALNDMNPRNLRRMLSGEKDIPSRMSSELVALIEKHSRLRATDLIERLTRKA